MGLKPVNTQVKWLMDMMSFLNLDQTKIPGTYRERVLESKALLENDETGIVTSLLDTAISSATNVDYAIDTSNENLTILLNNWLETLNYGLLGKIPTGIEALAKEYFRERWKGSSFLVLRTMWEEVDGYKIPTKMWFVDGEDIVVECPDESITLGSETYSIRLTNKKIIPIGKKPNEKIFVQKPFSSWGTQYPTPFLIQRGLFKNISFLILLMKKGEMVTAKALEYLMLVKKGTEKLALEGRSDFIYSSEDLNEVKKKLGVLASDRNNQNGITTYASNFDTDIQHLIPEYEKILKEALFL